MHNYNQTILNKTKAEVLFELSKKGFAVPNVFHFSTFDWNTNHESILNNIITFADKYDLLAIRSSSLAEDTALESMAGAFESILNVNAKSKIDITNAIERVINSYTDQLENQVLIQPMIKNVVFSGVVMTRTLDDGSPYYVVNYDDTSGKTDTVTNGKSINKTVYIYNGVTENDFDSPYLLAVIELVWQLELFFTKTPLDIEFAIDKNGVANLLQVRRITTLNKWNNEINTLVSQRMQYLVDYVEKISKPRPYLFGKKTLLGLMPDWNPAEMIGVVPQPLALSLYRELITKSSWRLARERMGYRKMPNVDLMLSLFGRTYIDVRNSMNSFLPEGMNKNIAEKIIDAYTFRLENDPHLHDKLEFEVVPTVCDFQFNELFNERYPNLLTPDELQSYRQLLQNLTENAISISSLNSLDLAMNDINHLKQLQLNFHQPKPNDIFILSDKINTLLSECIEYGTIPFSVAARHGFIAESFLRSAIKKNAITQERITLFRQSVKTIAGEMSEDYYAVHVNRISKELFLSKYGHLRPSSYDILSPCYSNRIDLFNGTPKKPEPKIDFNLQKSERDKINTLITKSGFSSFNADDLMQYAQKSIIGREYAKFIFTKHLSEIIECIAAWGKSQGLKRSQMAMLKLDDILEVLFTPLTKDIKKHYLQKIENAVENHSVAKSFKLSYLIRSTRDIYVVPQQRSSPNFIGQQRLESNVFLINPYTNALPDLKGLIICIEGADPGYDWIFSHQIAGLVTKYGGANSHMAIRCAEYGIPAAIGCGEQPFDRIIYAGKCLLDCNAKRLEPIHY